MLLGGLTPSLKVRIVSSGKYFASVQSILDELRADFFENTFVHADLLPVEYRGKRKLDPSPDAEPAYRKLASIEKQFDRSQSKRLPPRERSATFGKIGGERVMTEATNERFAAIESYRKQVEAIERGEATELEPHTPCERRQAIAELNMIKAWAAAGIVSLEDFAE